MKHSKERVGSTTKKVIKKYALKLATHQSIDIGGNMPEILTVREQNDKLTMWVMLEVNYPGRFYLDVDIVETGAPFIAQGNYVDTILMTSGKEFHVFGKSNYIRADR